MLYFLKGILYFFKGSSVHRVFFCTETSPSFKVIVVYMKGCPFVQIKQCHTQTCSFTRTAVCLEGYFLKGVLHTFERNNVYTCMSVCMHACMYVCMYVCMCLHVCLHVCAYACMHVCMYVCMHVCIYL